MSWPEVRRARALTKALAGALLGAAITALPEPARAADTGACWAANVAEPLANDGKPIAHPQHAALLGALDTTERLLRPNPGLRTLPDVRLRMRRQVLGSEEPLRLPLAAVLHAHGFGPKAWGRGPCELIAQADRLGPRAGISVFFNQPTATLNSWRQDEQLTAYLGRPASPAFQGWPTFGECAVLSRGRRLPWIPVSVGEMLAFELRDKQREIEAWDRDSAAALEPFDPAPRLSEADALQAQHPQAAEAIRLAVRQHLALEQPTRAAIVQGRARLVAERDTLNKRLAALDGAARAAPYRLSQAAGAYDVVRLDPHFPWDTRRLLQVQLVTVCAPQLEHNPAYHLPMREAVAALDLARLAALLD